MPKTCLKMEKADIVTKLMDCFICSAEPVLKVVEQQFLVECTRALMYSCAERRLLCDPFTHNS